MRFSIIMPVYNVEEYIQEATESIQAQNFKDFQLILVDDGSTDKSPGICDALAEKDHRIQVVHKKNGGVSNARNIGFTYAEGEYILYMDSDDVMCCQALQDLDRLIREKKEPELIVGNNINWNGSFEKIMVDNKNYLDKQKGRSILQVNEEYARENQQLPWRSYQSVCRRDFLEKYDLHFADHLTGAEDCEYYMRMCRVVKNFVLTDLPFVKYRMLRKGSIINTQTYPTVMGQLEIFAMEYELTDQDDYKDRSLMKKYWAGRYVNIIILVNMLKNKEEQDKCFQFIREKKHIIKDAPSKPKYQTARLLWKIFGYRKGSDILMAVKRITKEKR